jgi:serine/threonine protein kinase
MEGIKEGLLLGDANYGEFQSYIDRFNYEIDSVLRKQWSLQVAQAVEYIHGKGIIHSNLSTTNILVHRAGAVPELLLTYFGGSRYEALDVFGELLPDDPFSDPWLTDDQLKSPKLDLYSLGIFIYISMTGHQPFHDSPAPQDEERLDYMDRVRKLYEQGQFPDLVDLPFAGIIQGCCVERRFDTAKEVIVAIEVEMGQVA